MKINLPVTNVENDYDAAMQIISTTDLKGMVTYVNENFVSICGFSEAELIKKNHNVIRHPDMPPAAFADLWQTLKAGKSWMGIVKNRCKNGDHYWVDAYVTPMFAEDRVIGYQSVRVKPERANVDRAEQLYQQLNSKKVRRFRLPVWGVRKRLFALISLVLALPCAAMAVLSGMAWLPLGAVSLMSLGLSWLVAWHFTRPIIHAAREVARIVDNPVMQQVYIGGQDEIGKPLLAIRMLEARIRTILGRVTDAADNLNQVAEQTTLTVQQANQGIMQQRVETEQVATAMNEMASTVREVASSAERVSGYARETNDEAVHGKQVTERIIADSEALSSEITRSAEVIQALDERSKHIGVVLDVIKGVAEQTNLLALNAAIEAALAGEQGRGFAVVADEVRTLAQRTHDSTEEIEKMIHGLQADTGQAVKAMNQNCEQVKKGVERGMAGAEALESITTQVTRINDMNHQIASAAEEQSAVAEEINRNITAISQLAEEVVQGADEITVANDRQLRLVGEFRGMAQQFSC